MKFTLIFIVVLLFGIVKVEAQTKVTSISPSAFYTYSSYSDKTFSNSVSLFTTAAINFKDFISVGFDQQDIRSTDWDYKQQMLSFGGTKNLYPFYLGLFYSRIIGDYNSKPAGFSYTDKINVFDANILFNYNLFYFGISGNYINLNGFYNLNIKHYSAVVKRLFGTKFLISAKYTSSVISDGRNLNSLKVDISYAINNSLSMLGSTSFGNRAYYYDDELFAIFNQNETQNLNLSYTLKYSIIQNASLILNYTYSDFSDYQINYFVAGIKYVFD